MSVLNVLWAPHPILKTKSSPVDYVGDDVRKIMDDMLDTMYHDEGVGLAANQVGITKRILVFDLKDDDEVKREKNFYPIFMANPEIIEMSKEMSEAEEGCLSVPKNKISVVRHQAIKVKYLDYNNKAQELDAVGWLARVIQHEMDHIDGKLLTDYVSKMKRDVIIRKLQKIKRLAN